MKKIPTLFQRNHDGDRLVRNEVTPGCEWVLAGEGVATRKYDGTCCLVRDGKLYRRYEVRAKKLNDVDSSDPRLMYEKQPPSGFEVADFDEVTGKCQGWVPVGDGPDDKWHREAFECGAGVTGHKEHTFEAVAIADGTWELVGPKIQGNPENAVKHLLMSHGACPLPDCPRNFNGIKAYLSDGKIEGVVWHHPDGRMVKIKGRDFGIRRVK